ncbi:MAG: glycosyltransferase family 4 protein [Candidatus Nealsonbacteria bacterium]
MKKVLFISVTRHNFKRDTHLQKKFEGLNRGIKSYVLAKGKMVHKNIWGADFYLFPPIFFWPLAFCFSFWFCLVKKIDVIVSQSPLLEGFLGTILKKIFKKELIVEIHGDWQEGPFLSKKRKLAFLERKFIPFLAKTSLKNADKVRAISNFTIEKAKSISKNKPYFIFPTFTDLNSFFKEKDLALGNFILFVGQLQKVKGIEYLIDAFSEISKEFPNFKLVLVGEGQEESNLKSKISDLKLEEKVEFKGKLSLFQTKETMKGCYCLVLPSLSEGLGRVLIEAMALEKPVVGSRIGGIIDLVKEGQNGFLFEVGNSSQLAEKLRALLRDRDLAFEMGKKGKEFAKSNFSNENYINSYLKMINS